MACVWAFTFCSVGRAAERPTQFSFNGPDTAWQVDEDREVGRVLLQECIAGGARDSAGYERIVLAAPAGESVRIVCPTAPVVVINELEVRIWVKASRPDIQLAARIALPRTAGASSPSMARVLVRGARYQRTGHWQQLVLNGVPRQLAAEVRVLRARSETKIDSREAFLDAVVLVVPGDPAGVEVATDELVVEGVVRSARDDVQPANYSGTSTGSPTVAPATRSVPAELRRLPNLATPAASAASAAKDTARLHGDLFLVDDKPFLPRAIQYQGEPLQLLGERGFNVAWLNRAPTEDESAAAKKHGLWFIGRPPLPEAIASEGLGRPNDRVIAWFLGDGAVEGDPNYARRWADLVRERDVVAGRPVILAPHGNWTAACRTADVLFATRPRLGLIPSAEYGDWLAHLSPQIRPGTPLWVNFPSQFAAPIRRQVAVLSGDTNVATPAVPAPQLSSLVEAAYTRGLRGFAFASDTPISEVDAATRARAVDLELINRRLQRLEPWLASGKVFGRFVSSDPAWSAVVLNVNRAQLLMPMANSAARETASTSPVGEVAFVVPGVPESCQMYCLTPVALKTLPTQRIAGGTRFAIRPEADAFVLITEDPRVVQSLRQHIGRYGERVVRLLRESAALKAEAVAATARRLAQRGVTTTTASQVVTDAAGLVRQIDAGLASHRVEQAYQSAMIVNQKLENAAAELRRTVVAPTSPYSNPLAFGDDTLAEYAAFEQGRSALQFGENLLYGGDFEDLGQLKQIGWQHYQNQSAGVESRTELSVAEPRHGSYCLVLQAATTNEPPAELDPTSVWVESPPMAVTERQILEIAGWVRVGRPSANSGDGLQIVDSVGGPELALTIRQTNGWERFHIIRAIPESTELRLTFALSGVGTAQLDAVMVRPIQQSPAPRLPVLAPANASAASSTPTAAGPLFVAPGETR